MSPLRIRAARLASRAPLRQQAAFRRTISSTRDRLSTLSQPAGWVKHQPLFSTTSAPADWGRIIKSRATNLAIFIPGMAVALGWPYLASAVVDGHVE
ncbi:hypothetical protein HD806DRAFT_417996 [Xylariaceae sp. AK1471]|nr:hypothetical protein HD806DRAFT_417996 [Xylariaceae sp. AK1471]